MESEATAQSKSIAFQAWFEVNKKRVFVGLGIAVVLILGVSFFIQRQAQRERVASEALSDIRIPFNPAADAPGAANELLKVADDYKGTKAAERAILTSAGILYSEKKYTESEARFNLLLKTYPDTMWAPEANLGVAASLDAQGKTADATTKYEEIRRRFSTASIIDEAKLSLARLYEGQKPEDAYKLYDELSKGGPGTRLAMEASLRQEDLLKARPELAKLKESMAPPAPTMQNPGTIQVLSNQLRSAPNAAPNTPRVPGTSAPVQIKLNPAPTTPSPSPSPSK